MFAPKGKFSLLCRITRVNFDDCYRNRSLRRFLSLTTSVTIVILFEAQKQERIIQTYRINYEMAEKNKENAEQVFFKHTSKSPAAAVYKILVS